MSAEWSLLGKLVDSGAPLLEAEQLELLHTLVQLSLQLDNRKALTIEYVRIMSKLLSDYSDGYTSQLISTTPNLINETTPSSNAATLLHNTLKLLRNICAGVPGNQEHILTAYCHVTSLLSVRVDLATSSRIIYVSPAPHDAIVTTTLQLLNNLCVGYPEAQTQMWKQFFPHTFKQVKDVLRSGHHKGVLKEGELS